MKTIYTIILLLFITQVSNAQIQGYNLNDVVSDFTVTDIHGGTHTLYDYTAAGKYVYIDFSFVACGPCQQTAPKFNEFYDKYGCNAGEVVCMSMFGIDSNDTNSAVQGFEDTYGGSFNHAPAVSVEGGATPVDTNFNPQAYPTICLINPDNQIIVLDIWPVNTIADLEATFPTDFNPTPMNCSTASVKDVAQIGFELYPNVTSDFVNLEVDESVSAELINTQGQIIKLYNFEAGSHTIDVSSFSKQLYYLKLNNNKGQQSLAKLIVK